jgi:phenylacetate 2-hydroxylase
MNTEIEGFALVNEIYRALVLMLGVAVTSIILGGSKSRQELMNLIYCAVDRLFGGAPRTVDMPGPTGFPVVGNLYQMKDGHVQVLSKWVKKYGPVMRIALGERDSIFINSHSSIAQTIVAQGPAFQSRQNFKLFHNVFASSGIWTVGTSPYSDRLARTRKALSTQIAPRLLPM